MENRVAADQLRLKILGLKNLPTIPIVLVKVLDLVEDINSTIAELEAVIMRDQSIAAKVLGLSNSAFYGFGRDINSIAQAILVVGFNAVKCLAIGVTVFEKFFNEVDQQRVDVRGLWMHAVATAECTRTINTYTRLVPSETAFISGLLHDIGKVALIACVPDDYGAAINEAQREQRSLFEVEQEAFEINHAIIGSWIAQKWHLPMELARCIGEHHNTTYDGLHSEVVQMVAIADHLTKKLGLGDSGDPVVQPISQDVLSALKLSSEDLTLIESSLVTERERIEQFFEILM